MSKDVGGLQDLSAEKASVIKGKAKQHGKFKLFCKQLYRVNPS